jgi:hypothetical protein
MTERNRPDEAQQTYAPVPEPPSPPPPEAQIDPELGVPKEAPGAA